MTQPSSPDDVMDVYVPGRWRCLTCQFQLSSATIFMGSGEIGCTRDQVMNMTGECCPNDGTPMVRVTWREEADANRKWGTDLMEEIIGLVYAEHLPGAIAAIGRHRKALASIAASACCDRCNEAKLVAQAALDEPPSNPARLTDSEEGTAIGSARERLLAEQVTSLSSQLAGLRTATEAFLAKWALVLPQIDGVFSLQQIRSGVVYKGPTINVEIDALRAALAVSQEPTKGDDLTRRDTSDSLDPRSTHRLNGDK